MTRNARKRLLDSQYLRGAMAALALVLPTLSLTGFGVYWLWQNNLLIIWSLAATGTALGIYGLEYWLVRRGERDRSTAQSSVAHGDPPTQAERAKRTSAGAADDGAWPAPGTGTGADAAAPDTTAQLPPREAAAWTAIETIADDVDIDALDSRDAILSLGKQTIEAVAANMHPGDDDPMLKFTLPEALMLIEQVATRLNDFVVEKVPLGDRLTVRQARAIYQWRSAIPIAEKAYDLWRILRFVNPATAIAGEVRERVSGQLLDGVRTELARRVARAYVREVGRAAIDLYSGRLRADVRAALTPGEAAGSTAGDTAAQPISVLVVGQSGVGKSTVCQALSHEAGAAVATAPPKDGWHTITLIEDAEPFATLIEAPALDGTAKTTAAIVAQVSQSDAVLLVVSALRPDRANDADLVTAVREAFANDHSRNPPPLIGALTHVDRLRPANEWSPPYDLDDASSPKARSIADAVAATAQDVRLDSDRIVPVRASLDTADSDNIDLLWGAIIALAPVARNAQVARRLASAGKSPVKWTRVWKQALGAGKLIRRELMKR